MDWNGWDTTRFDRPDLVVIFPKWKVGICKRAAWGGRAYYKILEVVTPDGLYIEWEGLFDDLQGAVQRVEKVMSGLPWSA